MKKGKKIALIFLIILLILGISYAIYGTFNSNNKEQNTLKEKAVSEISYIENKFLILFNSLNNIKYENYKISLSKIDTNTVGQKDNSSNSDKDSSSSSGGSSGNDSNQNGQENQGNGNFSQDENINKYNLELQGVLNDKKEINWYNLKNEIELLYTSLPTITLDLYQLNINKDDVLNFNKDFDSLAISVNNENKEETLTKLTKLYDYLPKFLENTNADNNKKIIIKTKSMIFKAYSLLESGDWQKMDTQISNAIDTFNKLLTTNNLQKSNQYNINKCYIMLNELKNATNEKNSEIFLIKYKNLLEEISNI